VLLDQNNDVNVMDNQNNKPIHYAAVCSQPSSLELLFEKGASAYDVNT
jgi:ankyrin repeat protein